MSIQQALFFSFLKKPDLKKQKIVNINFFDNRANKNETIYVVGF